MDGGEMGLTRSWDTILPTWMEVTRDLDGIETQILGPGCNWYGTWMEVRHTPGDIMDGVKWDLQGMEMPFSGGYGTPPGWRRDANMGTWIEQPGWRLYATWMEVTHEFRNLDEGEMGQG